MYVSLVLSRRSSSVSPPAEVPCTYPSRNERDERRGRRIRGRSIIRKTIPFQFQYEVSHKKIERYVRADTHVCPNTPTLFKIFDGRNIYSRVQDDTIVCRSHWYQANPSGSRSCGARQSKISCVPCEALIFEPKAGQQAQCARRYALSRHLFHHKYMYVHTQPGGHINDSFQHVWREKKTLTSRVMPSSIHRCSVRSHVPVAVLLTSPLSGSTAYNGALPCSHSQISVRVTQPPRVLPSSDSTYTRSDPEEYRSDTGVLESHFGLAMASFGESVSAASARLAAARRFMITAVWSIVFAAIGLR